MATQITLTKIAYGNTASAGQSWRFEYKLPASPTWTLANAAVSVDAAGVLAAPIVITGLTAGSLYYVRSSNNCSSPRQYYTQEVQL